MRTHHPNSVSLKSLLLGAVLAVGLAACGGGGGSAADTGTTTAPTTSTPADTTPAATSPTVTSPTTTTPGTGTTTGASPPAAAPRFYASWTAALQDVTAGLPGTIAPAAPSFDNQTIRQVVRLSLGGDALRIKVSNRFGKAAATFSGVRVARSNGGSSIETGSERAVTFGGQTSVSLAAGAESTSDPVALPVAALSHVAVTMHFAGPTAMPTMHVSARQTAYVAAGNQLSAPTMEAAGAIRRDSYYGLAAVETSSTESAKVVVAFGDSMTDGFGSPIDADRRYPNLLDNRLKAAGLIRTGVVNAGIGGNRWIHDFAGPSGNSRFDRDVLALAGVTHAVILMGINDIGFGVEPAPSQEVSAQQIIDSIAAAVSRARASGVRVLLATLLPYEGAGYFSQAGEAKRQTVNAWIRGNPDAAVVDFDLLMRNPADPAALDPAYDSGDHLHPNDAGYAAMAGAVDLALLQ